MRPGNPLLTALWQTDRRAAKEEHIRPALARARGNVRAAALELGIHYRTLYRWLAEEPDLLDWGGVSSTCPMGDHRLGTGEGCGNCERYAAATASTIPPASKES